MRCAAVNRFVHPAPAKIALAARLADARRWQQPDRSGKNRRFVSQNIAEHILGHDHVELGRPLDEHHRHRIDQNVLELNIWIGGPNFGHDLAPQSRRFDNVRFVDRGDLRATRSGQIERKPRDPVDLMLAVNERVQRRAAAPLEPLPPRPAKIQTAGQLAHNHHVDAGHDLGLNRRRVGQCRHHRHWAEIGEQPHAFTERQESQLRPGFGIWVVPLRTADRAKQDRVRLFALLQVFCPERDSMGIDRGAANQQLFGCEGVAE